ncbi:S8 family peptidase [Sporanaerobacter sp. PP17-6a]|uniref:S8 family peptidase n=1 Tax=Sporanaerobacter sp. PP17-6a TaxID=1891289 RepID=UPI0008A06A34|nr:S8 family peptidase [Sporanaerobacter sp. PP17-6a]SCL85047.1 Subtilase family protein [Sporanaerobacter sp. PP17-6a]
MSNEKLPIKFFAPREVDELRVEPGGNSEPPKWLLEGEELAQRSAFLSDAFDSFKEEMFNRQEKESAIPFIFVAKMCNDSTAKSRRKDISTLFQFTNHNNVIGLANTNELIVRLNSIAQMREISSRLKDYDHNNYAISCLENFWKFEPIMILKDEQMEYKVKLIDFQDYEQNLAIQRLFERTLYKRGIEYKRTDYSEQYPIYKILHVSHANIDSLKDEDVYEALFSIEPMPKYFLELDSLSDENHVDIIRPRETQRYVTIGILDNGIAPIPHLAPWIVDKRWTVYPDKNINPTHGTFVAGIALYGDICEQKDWVGHHGIKIFDATVFPDTDKEGLDEDDLIANIKEAIAANYQNIKIWNLSISITKPVSDTKFSDFAIALDFLQDQYNVLICKSAGNCSNFAHGLPKGRIHEGADSVRSLVVGSVAQDKGKYDFVDIDNPSPFSRIGPGPEYIIKPEVSHYGGNAGIDNSGKLVITGVKSFSKDGKLSSSVGTSFSTPRITSLAAGLYQELNEEFDPLLLKALIIHSASYTKNLKVPITERTKQLGFGVPKTVKDIIYNAPHEATLILRDSLAKGEYIDIMDFPMPTCLIHDGFYSGQVIATLVYDPILDPTQGIEYCQSNVDVKFGSYDAKTERDISKRNILNPVGRQGAQNLFRGNLYSKMRMREKIDDFALRERLLIQYGDKYYPVKKYAVDLSELTESNKLHYLSEDKNWYLYVRGLFRDHTERKAAAESIELSQEICLIITIRDPAGKENVYDEVTQKLDEFNFWHSNIKISSDVNISIK